MQVKYSKTEFGFGLFKSESIETTEQIDGNFPEEKPPDTESRKRPRICVLSLFGILFKYGLIAKEVVEFIEMFRNLLG
jgi:hypothetical protein